MAPFESTFLTIALSASCLFSGIVITLAVLLSCKPLVTHQKWVQPVAIGLTPMLLLHTALLGRDTWQALAEGDGDRRRGWEGAVHNTVLLAVILSAQSYWVNQLYTVTYSKPIVFVQALLAVLTLGAGVADGVLTYGKSATVMSDQIGFAIPAGILIVAPTLLLIINAGMTLQNMPRSVHRLDPSSLRFGIIALELAVLPFVLSAATTALFFALPESRLYLVLRLTWPGVYLTNLFLCLLCKSNKRFALFSASTFRNADSFGNESLERAERSTWSFKYNSLFKPKLFLASNDVESSKGDFLTRRGRDIAPQALSVPNGTVDTSMRQSFQDDVSIYSSTALMGGHQGFFEPVTGQAYTTPVYDHHPYPEGLTPPRPPRVKGDTLRHAAPPY